MVNEICFSYKLRSNPIIWVAIVLVQEKSSTNLPSSCSL